MKTRKQVASCLALAIVALAAGSAPVHADIVNGGFEMPLNNNGGIPGWSASTSFFGSGWVDGMANLDSGASEGLQCAYLRAAAQIDSSLTIYGVPHAHADADFSQTFSATAGQSVSFDYYVISLDSGGSGSGSGGVSLQFSLSGGAYDESFSPSSPSSAYATYTFPAFTSNGTYTIDFQANADAGINGNPNDPNLPPGSWNSYVSAHIDNVQLVPEPSTLVLLGITAIGLVGYVRRRRA